MPLPEPTKGETRDDFMGRCMADGVMRREFPESDQRAAVCSRQWDDRKKGASMNEPRDFTSIPAAACLLVFGEVELGDNGEGAKTAPVRIVARTGKAIEHKFWGRVVHDFAGMHLSKPRVTIDYLHDEKEVIGYLNHFDAASGDLVTSGALVPFKDSDRATEILHKMRAGVPYEASINFGGDGIKVQEIGAGQSVVVNGAKFAGPGVVIREWPLRGVAICPYGADANTETFALAERSKVFAASVIPAAAETGKGDAMTDKEKLAAEADAKAKAVEAEKKLAAEKAQAEAVAAEKKAAEDKAKAEAVEAERLAAEKKAAEDAAKQKTQLTREEFVRIATEFGDAIAVQTVKDGGDYHAALAAYAQQQKDENTKLRARVTELEAASNGTAAKVTAAPKEKVSLFKSSK